MDRLHSNNESLRDEISFIDLVKVLWKQKSLILIVTVCALGISAAYLFWVKPVYEARAIILAPTIGDIAMLNVGRSFSKQSPVPALKVQNVYKIFDSVLESEWARQNFFKQIYWPSLTVEQQHTVAEDKLFYSSLKTIGIKAEHSTPMKYIVSARAQSSEKAKEWVEGYLALVQKQASNELLEIITKQNLVLADNVRQKIDSIKEAGKNTAEERQSQLTEAMALAKAHGIKNLSISVSSQNTLAIQLQLLENKYNFYTKTNIPTERFKMFRLDGAVYSGETPVAPKAYSVLILALFSGLILGSIAGLMRHSLLKTQ